MILRFRTMTGSEYEINSTAMAWRRCSMTPMSGRIRDESGHLVSWPNIKVGEEAHLEDSNIQPGCYRHIIRTTTVMKIWEVTK